MLIMLGVNNAVMITVSLRDFDVRKVAVTVVWGE